MKLLKVATITAGVVLLSGCAMYTPNGAIATNVLMGQSTGNSNVAATKTGVACAHSVLGLVAWGDASIRTAAATAGITRIAYSDYSVSNVLGFYGTYCTTVYGS